jgi:two-component system, response regulator
LVEDNPDDAKLTLRAFKKNNITTPVVIKQDGIGALSYLFEKDSHERPELVLLDLKLPKMDGLEVLRQIRSHNHTRLIPIVILTSSLEPQDLIESYSLGANSYVRKPVDYFQFIEMISNIW